MSNQQTQPKKVYIAGPMSGLPNHNYPAFFAAEELIEAQGFSVVNPARLHTSMHEAWEHYMKVDISHLVTCDYLVLLEGWENSRGANLEKYIAEQLGLQVFEIHMFIFENETIGVE